MSFARNVRLAGLLALVTAAMLLAAPPAWAATISVDNLTGDGATIGADVQRAVLGINMTGGTSFDGVQVVLEDVGGDGDFDLALLSDLQASPDGIAVYRDDSNTGANEDVLDGGDTMVSPSGFSNAGGGQVDVTVSSAVPAAAEGLYTFFLTVRTSITIETGDDFIVSIPSPLLGCAFETTPGTLFCSGDTTATITADSTVPTATLTTKPATVDGNVVWTFSEDVVGVSAENVVLREDGSTDNLAATVTYDATAHTATINPDASLTPGATYDTIVNPASATDLVADGAGNPVANTPDVFTQPGVRFTPGVVRGNTWFLNTGYDATHDISFAFGKTTDYPLVGDWDKDRDFTAGVVRGNVWYLNNGTDGTHDVAFGFGRATDFPVVGDWDKDGDFTPGVVRGNVWYLNNGFDSVHEVSFAFGRSTDFPVVGDWDDDGEFTAGVVRGNVWYLNNDFDATHDVTFAFGRSTDFPVVGDWDGDSGGAGGSGLPELPLPPPGSPASS